MSVGIKEREHMVMDRIQFQMARREPSRWGSPMPNDIDMHGTSYVREGLINSGYRLAFIYIVSVTSPNQLTDQD